MPPMTPPIIGPKGFFCEVGDGIEVGVRVREEVRVPDEVELGEGVLGLVYYVVNQLIYDTHKELTLVSLRLGRSQS